MMASSRHAPASALSLGYPSAAVEHGCHEDVVAGAVDKGDVPHLAATRGSMTSRWWGAVRIAEHRAGLPLREGRRGGARLPWLRGYEELRQGAAERRSEEVPRGGR